MFRIFHPFPPLIPLIANKTVDPRLAHRSGGVDLLRCALWRALALQPSSLVTSITGITAIILDRLILPGTRGRTFVRKQSLPFFSERAGCIKLNSSYAAISVSCWTASWKSNLKSVCLSRVSMHLNAALCSAADAECILSRNGCRCLELLEWSRHRRPLLLLQDVTESGTKRFTQLRFDFLSPLQLSIHSLRPGTPATMLDKAHAEHWIFAQTLYTCKFIILTNSVIADYDPGGPKFISLFWSVKLNWVHLYRV